METILQRLLIWLHAAKRSAESRRGSLELGDLWGTSSEEIKHHLELLVQSKHALQADPQPEGWGYTCTITPEGEKYVTQTILADAKLKRWSLE